LAEKKGKVKLVFLLSSLAMTIAIALFSVGRSWEMVLAVIIFFFGFNLMEPVLQSFVSKVVKANQKATALSLSNTIQYLGIFLGGAVTGYFLKEGLLKEFLLLATGIGVVWVVLLATFHPPKKLRIERFSDYDSQFIEGLKNDPNVYDFYEKEGTLVVRYLK
jgi:predicted MFS family arabinose efflux permease